MTPFTGSSPHTRGARLRLVEIQFSTRIIPAYAGSTVNLSGVSFIWWDHPRIRGEHEVGDSSQIRHDGSSPHTRGAHRLALYELALERIIPAYAGSTRPSARGRRRRMDHPRIRGEHKPTNWIGSTATGSSPHTRGAQRVDRLLPRSAWIIPAYAGSTPATSTRRRACRDHPRIRGEHSWTTRNSPGIQGSSPHTRGAHLEIPAIPRIAAVIILVFLYPSPTPQEEADRSMVLLTLS